MAGSSYMPLREVEQVAWSEQVVQIVGTSAAAYGVPTATMAAFTNLNATLQVAWTTASNDSTRTKGTIAAKKSALKAMKAAAKNIVGLIQSTATVTDQMKIDAGLTVRKVKPTPKPAPDVIPVLNVLGSKNRTVTLQLKQDGTGRGKPKNVATAMIFTASTPVGVGAPAIGDPAWQFSQNTTLTTVDVPCGASATGDTVHFTAFYCNAKAESGPAANVISVSLPAGGVLPAAVERMKLRAA